MITKIQVTMMENLEIINLKSRDTYDIAHEFSAPKIL